MEEWIGEQTVKLFMSSVSGANMFHPHDLYVAINYHDRHISVNIMEMQTR